MKYFILLLLVPLMSACDAGRDPLSPSAAELPVVVEGWIEQDYPPLVMVTHAADLKDGIGPLEEYVEKWVRVSVAVDGGRPQMLTGKIDNRYNPPFVFSTSRIRGRVGSRYTLMVETERDTIVATAVIPPPLPIDSLTVTPTSVDSLRSIILWAHVQQSDTVYYKIFASSRAMGETRLYSSFLGTFAPADYRANEGRTVNRGIHGTSIAGEPFSPLWNVGDVATVELATMTREGYDFWTAYEASVSLGGNLFFPVASGCPTNLHSRHGMAKGFWLGYGASVRYVPVH